MPSGRRPFFGVSVHQIVCHDFWVVASQQDMKELSHQPPHPPFCSENVHEMV